MPSLRSNCQACVLTLVGAELAVDQLSSWEVLAAAGQAAFGAVGLLVAVLVERLVDRRIARRGARAAALGPAWEPPGGPLRWRRSGCTGRSRSRCGDAHTVGLAVLQDAADEGRLTGVLEVVAITLTSRTPSDTGGSHERSTMRARSASMRWPTYRVVCWWTASW
jgi:hypothetical protein